MKMYFRTQVKRPLDEVKSGFDRDLFVKLAPQWSEFTLERFDGCKTGDEVHIQIHLLGLKQRWVSVITRDGPTATGWAFTDEGKVLPWPLKSWKHVHSVDRLGEKDCEIVDDIEFETDSKWLSRLIYPVLWSTFAIRPQIYKKYFEV